MNYNINISIERYGLHLRLQIEKGAKVDARAVDGSMPIHYAAAKGSVDLIKLLLANSNSNVSAIDQINARDHDQQTPLHRAAQKNRTEVSQ